MFEDRETAGGAEAPLGLVPGGDGAPGASLAAVLDGVDLSVLSDDALLSAMADTERMVAWAQGLQHATILAFSVRCDAEVAALPSACLGSGPALTGDEVTESEIAVALCLSLNGAANRLHLARDLSRLPLTKAALAAGVIDLAKARAVVEVVAPLAEDKARAVEATVLAKAPDQPVSRFRQTLRRAVLRADPAAAEARHARELADRRVEHTPGEDGMGELWLRGPVEGTVMVHSALTHLAKAAKAADRAHAAATGAAAVEPGMDARRVDALIAWARQVLAGKSTAPVPVSVPVPVPVREAGTAPGNPSTYDNHDRDARAKSADLANPTSAASTSTRAGTDGAVMGGAVMGGAGTGGAVTGAAAPGTGVLVNVTVSAETLLGISDEPAELAGHGPISAGAARRLAEGSIMRRLLLHPVTGTLLDVGTTTYTATAALDRHVRLRDQTCRAPRCTARAARCDLDHTEPYPGDPGTCDHNLGCLCRRHHRLKTAGLWHLKQQSPGVFGWRTITGRGHTIEPPDLRGE